VGQFWSGDLKFRHNASQPELQIPFICPSQLQITTSGALLDEISQIVRVKIDGKTNITVRFNLLQVLRQDREELDFV
jgi:hypothetical protein